MAGFLYRADRLKTDYEVFWNGTAGGSMEVIQLPDAENVFAFKRENEENLALILANISGEKTEIELGEDYQDKAYTDGLTNDLVDLSGPVELDAWGYRV